MLQIDLSGRVAVVTGGASGIGRAAARLLARCGAKVFVGDLRPLDENDAEFNELGIVQRDCDVRSEASIERLKRIDPLSPRGALFTFWIVLSLVALGVRAVMNRLHFSALGVNASLRDWFRLVTMTSFTNYLPFSAGLVAKGLFLQRVHAMPIRRFEA